MSLSTDTPATSLGVATHSGEPPPPRRSPLFLVLALVAVVVAASAVIVNRQRHSASTGVPTVAVSRQVPPPSGVGIRVPMVIVSPFAKRGFTDHHDASIASMAAFTERVFRLKPLGTRDRLAYGFMNSFDFRQTPLAPVSMVQTPIPPPRAALPASPRRAGGRPHLSLAAARCYAPPVRRRS